MATRYMDDKTPKAMQGDVSIVSLPLPKGLEMKPLTEKTVLIGEGSSHHHVITADPHSKVLLGEFPDGRMFVNVLSGSATLSHLLMPSRTKANHDPITVGPGTWRFWGQTEYSELEDRPVID